MIYVNIKNMYIFNLYWTSSEHSIVINRLKKCIVVQWFSAYLAD